MKTCGVSAPKQLSRHSLKPLWWLSQLLSRRKRSRTSSAKRSSRVVFPIPGPPSTSCRCGFLWYLHSKERTTLRIQNADKCCKCCDAPRTRSLAVQPLTQRGFWEGLTLYWNGHQGLCPLPVSCPCERQLRPAHRRAEGSGNVLLLLEQGRGRVCCMPATLLPSPCASRGLHGQPSRYAVAAVIQAKPGIPPPSCQGGPPQGPRQQNMHKDRTALCWHKDCTCTQDGVLAADIVLCRPVLVQDS